MARIETETVFLVVGAGEFGDAIGLLLEDEAAVVNHVELSRELYQEAFHQVRPWVTVIDCVTEGAEGLEFYRWLRLESGIAPHPCVLILEDEPDAPPAPELRTAPTHVVLTPIRHHAMVDLYHELKRPAAPRGQAPAAPARAQPTAAPPPPPTAPVPARARVMIVDDEPGHSQLLAEFLETGGYEALQCPAPRAFEFALLQKPHLIVMDIRMPVIDGITLTGVLKFCHLTRHIPIVMLTAHSESRFVEASRQARASAFIPKPVRGSQFLATIREILAASAA